MPKGSDLRSVSGDTDPYSLLLLVSSTITGTGNDILLRYSAQKDKYTYTLPISPYKHIVYGLTHSALLCFQEKGVTDVNSTVKVYKQIFFFYG